MFSFLCVCVCWGWKWKYIFLVILFSHKTRCHCRIHRCRCKQLQQSDLYKLPTFELSPTHHRASPDSRHIQGKSIPWWSLPLGFWCLILLGHGICASLAVWWHLLRVQMREISFAARKTNLHWSIFIQITFIEFLNCALQSLYPPCVRSTQTECSRFKCLPVLPVPSATRFGNHMHQWFQMCQRLAMFEPSLSYSIWVPLQLHHFRAASMNLCPP